MLLNNLLKCGYKIKTKDNNFCVLEKNEIIYDTEFEGYVDIKHKIEVCLKAQQIEKCDEENIFEQIEKNINKGFVYIIKANEKYKIGCTGNIINRLNFFKNTLPVHPILIDYIICDDQYRLEKSLHLLFKNKRYKNEWFFLDQSDIELIRKIKENYF